MRVRAGYGRRVLVAADPSCGGWLASAQAVRRGPGAETPASPASRPSCGNAMTSLTQPINTTAYRAAVDANLAHLRVVTPIHVTLSRAIIARQTGLRPQTVAAIEARALGKLRAALQGCGVSGHDGYRR